MKLTEDEIILSIKLFLEKDGWFIGDNFCINGKRGIDLKATRENETLIVEAKGARARDNAPTKRREFFDSGQIKNHLGEAIVKILGEKHKDPRRTFAIAHPDDKDIKRNIGHLVQYLRILDIKHYWVTKDGMVIED